MFILSETVGLSLPYDDQDLRASFLDKFIPVTMAEGSHPFPFRTRPLSPPAPMVLSG